MFDVVSFGEALIDFSPQARGKMGNPCFEMNPGGAVANCVVANSRLGGSTAIIGLIGNDLFGNFLIKVMGNNNVDTNGLKKSDSYCTTLAFVSIDDSGDRDFAFVRKPGADFMIVDSDIDYSLIEDAKIAHFGAITLSNDPGRTTQLKLMQRAKADGKIISYDPNYRAFIWNSEAEAIRVMNEAMAYADIVKVSEEELSMLTGHDVNDYEAAAKELLDSGKTMIFVTFGSKGAYYLTKTECGFCPGYSVNAVDTTGCGDAFTGAIHYFLTHRPQMAIGEMVKYACATGALCASGFGGIPSMPTLAQVEQFVNSH